MSNKNQTEETGKREAGEKRATDHTTPVMCAPPCPMPREAPWELHHEHCATPAAPAGEGPRDCPNPMCDLGPTHDGDCETVAALPGAEAGTPDPTAFPDDAEWLVYLDRFVEQTNPQSLPRSIHDRLRAVAAALTSEVRALREENDTMLRELVAMLPGSRWADVLAARLASQSPKKED